MLRGTIRQFFCAATLFCSPLIGEPPINQTADVSPIYPGRRLPFQVSVKQHFQLPNGIHSGVFATYKDKWLLFAGRTNGLHGFGNNTDNFPPQQQNTEVYVVDIKSKKVESRSLISIGSNLTRAQIDLLSVTSPQFYQEGNTLYITGGYGINTSTGLFDTKSALTAVDVEGLIHWVTHPEHSGTAAENIRQIFDPIFKVTGGYMNRMEDHSTLLVFGQNFDGYYVPSSSGDYTEVVRRFKIIDDGNVLAVEVKPSKPLIRDPNYRRRDLNVIPSIEYHEGEWKPYLVALSGVFTLEQGAWTVPVTISASGKPSMENPTNEHAFKQGMNNYICPSPGLFSKDEKSMYTLLLGGISYGYFENGQFETDLELPFINQFTVIKRNKNGYFKQYLLDAEYPVIYSTGTNPGNQLIFGAAAEFIPAENVKSFKNGVIKLDKLLKQNKSVTIGYVVGGLQSTLPNTTYSPTRFETSASPHIFKVKLKPRGIKAS